jgi:hypothetical protein
MKRKAIDYDEFLGALEHILDEFGNCDLGLRLQYFEQEARDEGNSEEDRKAFQEQADELERCFALVEDWHGSAVRERKKERRIAA